MFKKLQNLLNCKKTRLSLNLETFAHDGDLRQTYTAVTVGKRRNYGGSGVNLQYLLPGLLQLGVDDNQTCINN